MKNIINKYIYLNGRNVIFGLLSACFFSLIVLDSNKYYSVALIMAPSLLFSFVVGKMCYEEDSKSTKEFLLSLPMIKGNIVLEKNIVGQICILVGMILVNGIFLMVNILRNTAPIFDIRSILIIWIFLIVYNTIYVFLNYRLNYSKTQFTTYIIVALMLVLFKFGNNFIITINSINIYLLIIIVVVVSYISLIITKNIKWSP